MKAFVTFVVALALALVSAADNPVVSTHTSGSVTCTVTQDTTQPASTGLTAYIVTLSSAASIYSVDGRIDATSGYLNQCWAFGGEFPSACADMLRSSGYYFLTAQQRLDDTHVMVPSPHQVTYRGVAEDLVSGNNGATLCGLGEDYSQTMSIGFQGLSNYTSIPFARVVINGTSVAQFKFAICDGNKVKCSFDFAIPGQ